MESYSQLWKMLDNLIAEYRRKRGVVPQQLVDDLKSAKTVIGILGADPSSADEVDELEVLLGRIESTFLFLAESDFGREYADECSKKIINARNRTTEESISPPRFVTGIPRGIDWIRFGTHGLLEKKETEELATTLNLSFKWESTDSAIIYGERDKMRMFIRKVAEKIKRTRKDGKD